MSTVKKCIHSRNLLPRGVRKFSLNLVKTPNIVKSTEEWESASCMNAEELTALLYAWYRTGMTILNTMASALDYHYQFNYTSDDDDALQQSILTKR